jgi:hypothetical protein
MWGSRAPAKRGDGTNVGIIAGSDVLGAERLCDVEGRGQPQPMQVKLRLGSLS